MCHHCIFSTVDGFKLFTDQGHVVNPYVDCQPLSVSYELVVQYEGAWGPQLWWAGAEVWYIVKQYFYTWIQTNIMLCLEDRVHWDNYIVVESCSGFKKRD